MMIEENPDRLKDDYEFWSRSGSALMNLRLYREAAACFERAIKVSPETPTAWLELGTALVHLQEPIKAFKAFSEALRLDPEGEGMVRAPKRQHKIIQLNDSIFLEMVAIPGGKFLMGAPENEKGTTSSEYPQHEVSVPPFFMGKYPITQAQWRAIAFRADLTVERDLNPNPSHFKGDNKPVENVSWDESVEFCARLSKLTGQEYRLPSEAQWEYACRAGTTTPFHFGETIAIDLANYSGWVEAVEFCARLSNLTGQEYRLPSEAECVTESIPLPSALKTAYLEETSPVGKFPSNDFGLHDMHGNVWEWCADTWHKNYVKAPNDGSAWLTKDGDFHVQRGGSWGSRPKNCRSAYRTGCASGNPTCGFRIILG